jgi:hypothetical protein
VLLWIDVFSVVRARNNFIPALDFQCHTERGRRYGVRCFRRLAMPHDADRRTNHALMARHRIIAVFRGERAFDETPLSLPALPAGRDDLKEDVESAPKHRAAVFQRLLCRAAGLRRGDVLLAGQIDFARVSAYLSRRSLNLVFVDGHLHWPCAALILPVFWSDVRQFRSCAPPTFSSRPSG